MNVGASSGGKQITEELFASYKENGIECMELAVLDADAVPEDFGKIKEWADKYDVKLWSCHLPFLPFSDIDLSAVEEKKRKHTVECLKNIVAKAAEVGIDKAVVHASAEPIADEERPLRMNAAKKSLCELAEFAKTKNVTIAVEDLPRTCLGKNSAEIAELISVHDNLKVCFDTNHLLSEPTIDFIEKIGRDIITLHVSDYDFEDERHWLPGEGKIDWRELIAGLKKCGYGGVWMYELDLGKYMPKLRENAEKLLG